LLKFRSDISPWLESFKIPLFPEKNGMIRIGHCSTRCDLFFRFDDGSCRLAYCDFDFERLTDFDMEVSKFVYCLYRNEIDRTVVGDLHESIWCDESDPFFQPFRSGPLPEKQFGSLPVSPTDASEPLEKRVERFYRSLDEL